MTKDGVNDAMLREKFRGVVRHVKNGSDLSFSTDSAYAQAIIWASERIAELESQTQSPETDEEIHQRRRRERLLDEVTLICVRDRIEQLINAGTEHFEPGATTEIRWGRNSRDTADNICRGINEYDAK